MSFRSHIKYMKEESERLMPNIGGTEKRKCLVLYGVVQSVIIYDAPI